MTCVASIGLTLPLASLRARRRFRSPQSKSRSPMLSLDQCRWWCDKEIVGLVASIQSLAGAGYDKRGVAFIHGPKSPSTRTSDHFLLIFFLSQLLVITSLYGIDLSFQSSGVQPSHVPTQNRSLQVMRRPLNPASTPRLTPPSTISPSDTAKLDSTLTHSHLESPRDAKEVQAVEPYYIEPWAPSCFHPACGPNFILRMGYGDR